MNPRLALTTDFSLNRFCSRAPPYITLRRGSNQSMNLSIYAKPGYGAAAVFQILRGDTAPAALRGPGRAEPPTQQLQEKGSPGREPEAEGPGEPGGLMVRTAPPPPSPSVLSLGTHSQGRRAAVLHLHSSTTQKGPVELPFPICGTFLYN